MVHAGQQMWFPVTLVAGLTVRTVARVARIEDRGSGEMLTVACRSVDGDDRVVPEVLFERRLGVDEDQALRYAEASGDHNPIHVDEDMAKAMGFPRTIVHGLCVMALAQKAVLDGAAGGRSVGFIVRSQREEEVLREGMAELA